MTIGAHGRIWGVVLAVFFTIVTYSATLAETKEEFIWVRDATVAAGIAEAVLTPFLKDQLKEILPLQVELDGDKWKVMPKPQEIRPGKPGMMGGSFALWIDRRTGAILKFEMSQ